MKPDGGTISGRNLSLIELDEEMLDSLQSRSEQNDAVFPNDSRLYMLHGAENVIGQTECRRERDSYS